jgi:AcrR family transcriptional regulator
MLTDPGKTDKRVQRSCQLLREALIELMIEQAYETVTVQHILDRARVGRATFYVHFRDKEALLRSSIDSLHKGMVHRWNEVLRELSEPHGGLRFPLLFFRHVDKNRKLHEAITRSDGGVIVDRYFRRMLADMFRTDLAGQENLKDPELEASVQFLVGGMMSLMSWWLDHNVAMTPDEINKVFLRLAKSQVL